MLISIEKLLAIVLVILMFSSNPLWFLWGFNYYIVGACVLFLLTIQISRLNSINKKNALFAFLYILLFCYFVVIKGFFEFRVSSVLFFVALLSAFLLKEKEKVLALDYITKTYAIILGVSFVFWFIHNFLYQIPYKFDLMYGDLWGKAENLTFYHYIFFIQPQMDYVRFYSVFDEPGVIGTFSAFILFAQKYNFKKISNVIILVASFFSYSLAFYVITFLGMVFIYFYENRIKSILALSTISLVASTFILSIESFRLVVLNRFNDFGDSLSRRNGVLSSQFYEEFLNSTNIFFGMPLNFLTINKQLIDGQSYKFFIIEYGVVGVFLICLIYLFFAIRSKSLFSIVLFLIFLISFVQRPFLFTPWQIILFVLICSYFSKSENSKLVSK
jgi:hypothetical protein